MFLGQIGCVTNDEYPYLNQLSLPDLLRLAAYEARDGRQSSDLFHRFFITARRY